MLKHCAWILAASLMVGPAWAGDAVFSEVRYHGDDGGPPVGADEYRNPVVAGFYPDPSAIRVGDDFYLVTSTFGYFPGLPVFHSTDLVSWTQVGNAIHRPGQIDYGEKEELTRGLFAATLAHHDDTFYVANTCFYCDRGNFVVTAKNPAGPWSDPIWLGISGIDPSLFFDDDGSAWIVHNDVPDGKLRYEGHRAIWLQRLDFGTRERVGQRILLVDGGADPATNPEHVEGPHLFKHDGWYYLTAAEGGTGEQHAQMVWRSRALTGPYQPSPSNPALTQRDLDPKRADPVTSTGHAQFVKLKDGTWWAVFLASRNYQLRHYNTGRETYLLPVQWRDGWPEILPAGKTIPYVVKAPSWMRGEAAQAPSTGNFVHRDEFDGAALALEWLRVRVPKTAWADLATRPGALAVHPLAEGLETLRNPAFLGRRQQHLRFEASTSMTLPAPGVAAGLAAFQSEAYWYFLGVRRIDGGRMAVFLEARDGSGSTRTLATRELAAADTLRMKIDGDEGEYGFSIDVGDGRGWQSVASKVDGTVLSTDRAGGFVGALLGPFARDERSSRSE